MNIQIQNIYGEAITLVIKINNNIYIIFVGKFIDTIQNFV